MDRVTVMVSRGTEDERTTSPLEIARGDRLRIGATHWEKQLFNGTVVTVDDFKVERAEAGTEPSVLISARTEDGRAVSFHHDEIRDWYGNIRLDHGYAMTITSAQGLTVDRAFLLADARPARETIYPAATRHREGLDIYVNRAPLALDIADRRADNDRESGGDGHRDPGISGRALVAVAAQGGGARLHGRGHMARPAGACRGGQGSVPWRNPRMRRARSGQRRTTTRWRVSGGMSGALPSVGATPRRWLPSCRRPQEVLASYDDLRERSRAEGDTVALGGSFPGDPHPPCGVAETGRGLPRPAGRIRLPAGRTRRYRAQGSRRLRGTPCPGAAAPACRHDALCASDQEAKRNRRHNNRNPNCGRGSWRSMAAAPK